MLVKKISRHYRIREDILAELSGMMLCINRNLEPGQKELTETFIVESAIVSYVKKVKRGMEGIATLKAKCIDLNKEEKNYMIPGSGYAEVVE